MTIDGTVDTPLDMTYDQLVSEFSDHSVVATLACAGNRRAELLQGAPDTGQGPVGPRRDLDRRMARSQAGRRPPRRGSPP